MSKTLTEQQCDFTFALSRLIDWVVVFTPYMVKIQELNRTIEQQREYVRTGKSKTMKSKHLDKLAVDLVLFKDGKVITEGEPFRVIGRYWEKLGTNHVWGGSWGETTKKVGWDSGHFQAGV